jgi:FAD/FMN-containing dehydrogenase
MRWVALAGAGLLTVLALNALARKRRRARRRVWSESAPRHETFTVGGAVAGCSLESMSFRRGGFHDTCLAYEVITGDGDVLTAMKAAGDAGQLSRSAVSLPRRRSSHSAPNSSVSSVPTPLSGRA